MTYQARGQVWDLSWSDWAKYMDDFPRIHDKSHTICGTMISIIHKFIHIMCVIVSTVQVYQSTKIHVSLTVETTMISRTWSVWETFVCPGWVLDGFGVGYQHDVPHARLIDRMGCFDMSQIPASKLT